MITFMGPKSSKTPILGPCITELKDHCNSIRYLNPADFDM